MKEEDKFDDLSDVLRYARKNYPASFTIAKWYGAAIAVFLVAILAWGVHQASTGRPIDEKALSNPITGMEKTLTIGVVSSGVIVMLPYELPRKIILDAIYPALKLAWNWLCEFLPKLWAYILAGMVQAWECACIVFDYIVWFICFIGNCIGWVLWIVFKCGLYDYIIDPVFSALGFVLWKIGVVIIAGCQYGYNLLSNVFTIVKNEFF